MKKFNNIIDFNADIIILSMGCDIIEGDDFNIMNCSTNFYKNLYDKLKNSK